jgi:hypothetical protein
MLMLSNNSLIVAGSETSATLLSGCIFYLCTAPHVMSRLVAEIRSTFKQDSDMTFRAAENLKYMNAVIEESLRIYPPFVTSLSRVVPQGGAFVNGHFLPEDVCICAPLYATFLTCVLILARQLWHVTTTPPTTRNPTSSSRINSCQSAGWDPTRSSREIRRMSCSHSVSAHAPALESSAFLIFSPASTLHLNQY